MSKTFPSRALNIAIACPVERAYDVLVRPENWPKWAAGLGGSFTQVKGAWITTGPDGPVRVRFSPPNGYGVLDHWVTLPSGDELYMPMRLIANGDSCEVVFTLFRTPDMTDAIFTRDIGWVERDLQALKILLEGEGKGPPAQK